MDTIDGQAEGSAAQHCTVAWYSLLAACTVHMKVKGFRTMSKKEMCVCVRPTHFIMPVQLTLSWALFMELGFVEVATRQAPRT